MRMDEDEKRIIREMQGALAADLRARGLPAGNIQTFVDTRETLSVEARADLETGMLVTLDGMHIPLKDFYRA